MLEALKKFIVDEFPLLLVIVVISFMLCVMATRMIGQ